MITATIPVWIAIGRWTLSASAPSAAPIIVPKLKKAWKIGMMVRPSTRSFAAPETFMPTSQIPVQAPKTRRPMKITAKLGPTVTPIPAMAKPTAPIVNAQATELRAPKRAMIWLEARSPTMEPAAMPKSRIPISFGPT